MPVSRLNFIGLLILRRGLGGFLLASGRGKPNMLIDGRFADPIGPGKPLNRIGVVTAEGLCSARVMAGLLAPFAAD
jgi:uncharacterized membrane protein YphA (DoxX/SURF4 family)